MPTPPCQLYLIAPAPLPADFASLLQAAAGGGAIAALRAAADSQALLMPLLRLTRARDIALILEGPASLAVAARCDGVHLLEPDGASAARRSIGDLQLGVFCGQSRDEAMRAGDAGADYVSFGPTEAAPHLPVDLIEWWSDLMEVPCVAEGGTTPAEWSALAQAGADFVAVSDAVWNDPRGPAEAIRLVLAAIAAV